MTDLRTFRRVEMNPDGTEVKPPKPVLVEVPEVPPLEPLGQSLTMSAPLTSEETVELIRAEKQRLMEAKAVADAKHKAAKIKEDKKTRASILMDGLTAKTIAITKALLTGTAVSMDQVQRRIEVCAVCDKVRRANVDVRDDKMWCGVCGCALKGDKSLVNLARYVETESYGCKHVMGSRWKAAGC